MKRGMDIVFGALASAASLPVVAVAALVVWLEDRKSPFYISRRIGRGSMPFPMFKLRSMIPAADRSGVDSTAADDRRITRVGRVVRALKIDELPQFWNVLRGEMSMVGPRPNVERETRLYTAVEARLLDLRPGVTDLSSIVFADYSEILRGSVDADLTYNQRIRPWKSRLSLLYCNAPWSLSLDLTLIVLTAASLLSRRAALAGAARIIRALGGDEALLSVARRESMPPASPPPGAIDIVQSRNANAVAGAL